MQRDPFKLDRGAPQRSAVTPPPSAAYDEAGRRRNLPAHDPERAIRERYLEDRNRSAAQVSVSKILNFFCKFLKNFLIFLRIFIPDLWAKCHHKTTDKNVC
jgi:hypothetical protein